MEHLEPYLEVFERSDSSALREPEVILPIQYFARLRDNAGSAEERVWCEVLRLAAQDWRQGSSREAPRKAQERAVEAARWINGSHVAKVSFEDACELVGLDPDYLRRGILSGTAKVPQLAHGAANGKGSGGFRITIERRQESRAEREARRERIMKLEAANRG